MVHSSIYTDLHRVCKASHVHSIFMLHALLLPQPSLSSNDFPCTAAYHADPTWSNWKCCGQLQSYKMTTWYVWSQKRCIRFLNLVLKKICAVLSTPCSSPQMWLSKRFSLNWSYVDVNLNASHVIGNPLLIPFNLQDLLRMSKSKGVFTRWHIFWPLKSTETNRISPTFTTAIQNLTLQHQRSKPSKNSINLNRDRNATLPHKKTISSRAGRLLLLFMKNGGELLKFVHRETFRMPEYSVGGWCCFCPVWPVSQIYGQNRTTKCEWKPLDSIDMTEINGHQR